MTTLESNLKGFSIVQQLCYNPTEEKAQEKLQQKGLSCDFHLWDRTLNELAWKIEKNKIANRDEQDPVLSEALRGPPGMFSSTPEPYWVCDYEGNAERTTDYQYLDVGYHGQHKVFFERKGEDIFFKLDFYDRPQKVLEDSDLVGYVTRHLQQAGLIDFDRVESIRDEFNRITLRWDSTLLSEKHHDPKDQ